MNSGITALTITTSTAVIAPVTFGANTLTTFVTPATNRARTAVRAFTTTTTDFSFGNVFQAPANTTNTTFVPATGFALSAATYSFYVISARITITMLATIMAKGF